MKFLHSKGFKYFKNLVIGIGASVVLYGALAKIEHWPNASLYLTMGLLTEAFLFAFLGIIGPEPDYYWDKLYPGLDDVNAKLAPLTAGPVDDLDAEAKTMDKMLVELQTMSKSLSSLKSLQEVDFTSTSKQMKTMGDFYGKMNEAMNSLTSGVDDAKKYQKELASLNKNLGSLNNIYGGIVNSMTNLKG